jgi:hypothetical protein
MSERLLAAFSGPVSRHIAPTTRQLVLEGADRASGEPLEVRFSDGSCVIGEEALIDIEVFEAAPAGGWRLRSGAREYPVQARAVQVHRDARRAFHAAVPGAKATLANRAGWATLLTLLRLPGAARLVRWLRSR